jgi:predicted dehydrogenase
MINAAIIGLGAFGQRLVSSVQNKSEKIRFVSAMTRTPAKAEAFAARNGFPVGDDLDAVLGDREVDAVVIATPHRQHAEQVIKAAEAGKHVFCEKPFTLTKKSAEAAVAACKKAGVVIAVGQNRRFLPATKELKRIVDSGQLGTLMHIEGNISGPSGHSYSGGWRIDDEDSPVGSMTPMGIHMLDNLIGLVGGVSGVSVQSVHRAVKVARDDTTSILLRFDNGMTGYLATIAATARIWHCRVIGDRGWVESDGLETVRLQMIGAPMLTTTFDPSDIERAELEAFADAAEGGTPYRVRPEEAIQAIGALEAIVNSWKTGAPSDVA